MSPSAGTVQDTPGPCWLSQNSAQTSGPSSGQPSSHGEGSPPASPSPSARCVLSGMLPAPAILGAEMSALPLGRWRGGAVSPRQLGSSPCPSNGAVVLPYPPLTVLAARQADCHTVCFVLTLQILTGGSGSWVCLSPLLPPVVQTVEGQYIRASMRMAHVACLLPLPSAPVVGFIRNMLRSTQSFVPFFIPAAPSHCLDWRRLVWD